MKIGLAKHGGLLAGSRLGKPPRIVDTETLEPAAAAELARLVAAAKAAPVPAPARPAPDAQSYTVTVEEDGRSTVLRQSDSAPSKAFADLLAWLEGHLGGP
ncbi:hypothetical protein OPKNFCMD_4770 [Methylobacterium crusticola]|uniref:Uncharacterized protein n=1 Tax=Methylobacterium crusticola TaxID=1697972 RepID=A0ABQ4R376_9HYPH|nr:protealysin inhibitor emfourin [Methylobacterium crusticola]GJD52008.1 hypothetical protein OPKNFCMD_4770 [Methylobacterium crusticola]